MQHMKNLRRTLRAAASIGGTSISTCVLADPSQGGYGSGSGSGSGYGMSTGMMDGYGVGWMNGYGGIWAPILLVIVVVALVAWIVQQKKK